MANYRFVFRVSYVVRLSDDIDMRNPKVYETKDHSISLGDQVEAQKIYYLSVSVKDAGGLESPPSPLFVFQQMSKWGIVFYKGGWFANFD